MKFLIAILTGFLTLCCHNSFAQYTGNVIEQNLIKSKILNKEMAYAVYLPYDYEHSTRKYPVVYLLHGSGDDNTSWVQFGQVDHFADKAIANGTIPPMIIVMPDADLSFYINSYDGKEKYEDYFIKELMPEVEKKFRIRSEKQFRGVAGLSMGGYGTLIYALKYPQLFAACAPLSAAVWNDDDIMNFPNYDNFLGGLYGKGFQGKDRLTNSWYANSILKIVESKSTDELNQVRYWIDCGDDDFLIKGNCLLHLALKDKKVAHEFRVRDGGHGWSYWRSGITDALEFIGNSFRRK